MLLSIDDAHIYSDLTLRLIYQSTVDFNLNLRGTSFSIYSLKIDFHMFLLCLSYLCTHQISLIYLYTTMIYLSLTSEDRNGLFLQKSLLSIYLLQYAGMQKYDNSVYMIHNENVFLSYIHLHSRAFFYGLLIEGGLSRLNVGYMIIGLLVYIVK